MSRHILTLAFAAGLATPLAAQDAGDNLNTLADKLGLTQPTAPEKTLSTKKPHTNKIYADVPKALEPSRSGTDERSAFHVLSERTRAWLDARGDTPAPQSGRPDPNAFDALFPLPKADAAHASPHNKQTDFCRSIPEID